MLENSSLKLASTRVKRINQLNKGSKTPFEKGLIELHKKDIKNLIKDNQLK